jgi:hypothetical protein
VVSAGGTASGTTVDGLANQYISSGGVAVGTILGGRADGVRRWHDNRHPRQVEWR